METKKLNYSHLLPVLMSFIVMSFVDLVGIGVDRVSKDMDLSATMGQLIPSAAFLWFLLLSVPTGILQARIGKRHMLNIGMGITAIGMLLPFFVYTFGTVLIGFALLGIGNTIVQVSANPLLVDVVPGNRISSFMSFSQFIKAVGSMIGAPLAALFAIQFGDWKLIFLVFGIVSIISVLWLGSIKVEERQQEGQTVTFGSAFKLLGNGFILLMVLSIFVVVGVDVGFNSNSGQFLIKHFGIEDVVAESGRSVYFFGRMLGTFLGAILLTKLSSRKFFIWTCILGIIALVIILFSTAHIMAWILVFVIGLAVA
ncbi:MAG: MFS transporter, partial [Bacteroidetes bacterium]|nr:MFS transporter [Bacteroidota bacterium]